MKAVDVGTDVRGADERSIPIPQAMDGVPTPPPISNRLEVGGVGVAAEHPPLGTAKPPISLFIRLDGRELVFEIIS